MFAESNARKPNKEYRRWLHLRVKDANMPDADIAYPWPFDDADLDCEKLLAHYCIHQFKDWPGPWPEFRSFIKFHKRRELWWGISTTFPFNLPFERYLNQLPKEFVDALTRYNEART